jgi:hypothetical protein
LQSGGPCWASAAPPDSIIETPATAAVRYNHDDFIFLSCERSKVFDGASGAVAFQQISTRRFCARPFGVSIEATGCVSPKPLAMDGDFCIPQI